MIGKDGKPTSLDGGYFDLNFWTWRCQFGLPGVMKDLNILEVSNHFSKVLSGIFSPVAPSFTISGQVIYWFYYLSDGIYPP